MGHDLVLGPIKVVGFLSLSAAATILPPIVKKLTNILFSP